MAGGGGDLVGLSSCSSPASSLLLPFLLLLNLLRTSLEAEDMSLCARDVSVFLAGVVKLVGDWVATCFGVFVGESDFAAFDLVFLGVASVGFRAQDCG